MAKGKHNIRRRSEKVLHRKRLRSNKYKKSGWKLKHYPKIFKQINIFPYIVRKDDERYK